MVLHRKEASESESKFSSKRFSHGKTHLVQLLYNCIMTVYIIHSHHLAEPNHTEVTGETVSAKYFFGRGLYGGGVGKGLLVYIFMIGKEERIGDAWNVTYTGKLLFWLSSQVHCQQTDLHLVDAKWSTADWLWPTAEGPFLCHTNQLDVTGDLRTAKAFLNPSASKLPSVWGHGKKFSYDVLMSGNPGMLALRSRWRNHREDRL